MLSLTTVVTPESIVAASLFASREVEARATPASSISHETTPGDPRLAEAVRAVIERPEVWSEQVRFDDDRVRVRLDVSALVETGVVAEGVDVWLLTWRTSQRTTLHDHGVSQSAFGVVSGALTQIRPDERGRLIPRRFVPGLVTGILPGETHDVLNESATPAVSIHAYSAPLETMTTFVHADGALTPQAVVGAAHAPENG